MGEERGSGVPKRQPLSEDLEARASDGGSPVEDETSWRRLALELRDEELLPLPRLPRGGDRHTILASFLRELFTGPGGRLEARAGAVFLDDDGRPRALTAPFAGEWPRANVQALELFATAKKAGWTRLVLFRTESNPHALPDITLRFTQEMRALGLLFGVEVVDLLVLKPRRHWVFSRVPLLRASLQCEATLSRTFDRLIVDGFERSLPPLEIPPAAEGGAPLRVERL